MKEIKAALNRLRWEKIKICLFLSARENREGRKTMDVDDELKTMFGNQTIGMYWFIPSCLSEALVIEGNACREA